uniref:CUB domain-containing protein n=1 Tax=Arion vulgaris TaxID=1028688 RepID=A0A0B7B527_9EUPU
MPTISLGFTCPTDHSLHITFLTLTMLTSSVSGACSRRELLVSTSSTLEYRAVGNLHWLSGTMHEDDVNVYCEVLLRASHEGDGIRLEVTDSNLQPRLFGRDQCLDKVTVYDGSSLYDKVLGDFCGQEVSVFESSGNSVLLVFEANKYIDDDYRGFIMNYSRINRSLHQLEKSQPSFGAGTVALAVISAAVLYCVLFVVLYRRCRYAQRMRHNLSLSGHTACDLRGTTTTLHCQPNQGQGQSIYNGGTTAMPDILTSLNVSSRPGPAHGQQRPGRVRHPAGDTCHYHSQQPQLTLLFSSHHSVLNNDDCSGYGSDRDELYQTVSNEAVGHVHPFLPVVSPDPSGVFYAGNVDEHGILHPPGDQSHLAISAAPSAASVGHPHSYNAGDDNRRSRESSQSYRSLCPSGRNSSQDSSHCGSSGCCSPYRSKTNNSVLICNGSHQLIKNMDTEGQTFTFYGMIDGVNSDAAASSGAVVSGDDGDGSSDSEGSASSVHNEDTSLCGAPPSYEDAAAGKYSQPFPKY